MTLPTGPRTDHARIDPLVVVINNMLWSFVVAPVGIGPLQLSSRRHTSHDILA
jgi:hypothetical protein